MFTTWCRPPSSHTADRIKLSEKCPDGYNLSVITENEMRQFAAAMVNTGDHSAAYRAIKPNTKSDEAADKGGRRMLARAQVQQYIEELRQKVAGAAASVIGQLTVLKAEDEIAVRAIAITEVQLINEYVGTALADYLDYYDMRTGLPKRLQDLTPEQRRNIKRIEWSKPAKNGRRKVVDYVLEDRAAARDQLAKITGIVGQDFDFAGLLALMTGKPKEQAAEEVQRLDHQQGVNIDAIRKRAGQIFEGEFREVK